MCPKRPRGHRHIIPSVPQRLDHTHDGPSSLNPLKCDRSQRRRRLAVAALVVVGLTAWTYSPVREFDFASYDDLDYVVENPHIVTGLSAANVVWAFKNPYFATGGPLTWLSHMGDAEWFGLNAGGHHVTSAILHTAGAVLLLAALFLATGSVIRSAIVAALFAVHPLHFESVAWVAERKDVLSGVWWFATIAAYVWYSRRPGWPR